MIKKYVRDWKAYQCRLKTMDTKLLPLIFFFAIAQCRNFPRTVVFSEEKSTLLLRIVLICRHNDAGRLSLTLTGILSKSREVCFRWIFIEWGDKSLLIKRKEERKEYLERKIKRMKERTLPLLFQWNVGERNDFKEGKWRQMVLREKKS